MTPNLPGQEPTAPAAQPATPPASPPAPQAPEAPQEPRYVTEESLAQLRTEIKADIAEGFRRAQQSASDRQKLVNKEIQTLKAQLNASGVQLSAEQEASLRTEIDKAIPEPQEVSPAGQPVDQADADAKYVDDQMQATFKKVGTSVNAKDPEWAPIEAALKNPQGTMAEFVLAVRDAAETKKTRLASDADKASLRSPGGVSSNAPAPKPMTPDQKLSRGLREESFTSAPPEKAEQGPS